MFIFSCSTRMIVIGRFSVVFQDVLHCLMTFPLPVQRFSPGLNICNKDFSNCSILLQEVTLEWACISGEHPFPSHADLDQMAVSLCWCLQGLYILKPILSHLAPLVGRCLDQNLCHPGESLLLSEKHDHDTAHLYGCDLEQKYMMAEVIYQPLSRVSPWPLHSQQSGLF